MTLCCATIGILDDDKCMDQSLNRFPYLRIFSYKFTLNGKIPNRSLHSTHIILTINNFQENTLWQGNEASSQLSLGLC